MADDPIERLTAEVEIFGIPQAPGMPPMTETYFHVRRRQNGAAGQAKLGLPAYKGEKGDPGPPGMIHKGQRTTAQLESLALGEAEENWAYRNVDTDDCWLWDGDSWLIYEDVFATPGPPGPPPSLSSGTLTIDGEIEDSPDYGVRVTGSDGVYVLGLDLPPAPQGEKGDTGSSGSIYTSIDVQGAPADGDVLTHDADLDKLVWAPGQFWTQEYVVPPSGFPNASKSSSDTRHQLCVVNIPAKPWPYRLDFAGGVDVESKTGHQIDLEVRTGSLAEGPLVGMGKGQDGEGWREVAFRAHSDVAIDPSSTAGVVAANTAVTLYVSAVKRAGILFGWAVRNDRAQLRIRLMRTA